MSIIASAPSHLPLGGTSSLSAAGLASAASPFVPNYTAPAYEQEFAGELTVGITGLSSDPLGLVFQEGSDLVDHFNEGLAMIKSNGTMDRLVIKWWPK